MAYTLPLDTVFELQLRYRISNQLIMIVRHYKQNFDVATEFTDGGQSILDFMNSWDNAVDGITTTLAVYATNEVHFEQIVGQAIYPNRKAYQVAVPAVLVGTPVPPTMSQNLTLPVTFQTDGAGRGERGNVFLAGWEAAAEDNGRITAVAQSHMGAVATTMTRSLSDAGAEHTVHPIIWSRATPALYKPITHYTTQSVVRTMSRRTVGHGV